MNPALYIPFENGVDPNMTFVERLSVINLPFCETPYLLGPAVSQPYSALLHLPYVPIFLLLTFPTFINDKVRFALKVQIVLQAFTAFGHCVPNPEVFFIAPISAMLMFMFIASVVDATHVTVTGKKDGKTWIDRLHNVTRFLEKVYRREGQGLTIYHEFFTFGVCMVVTILFSHIMVAILGMLPFFLMFAYTKNIFTNLTTVSRVILVLLFVVDVLILFGETYSCHWLLQINEAVPWHAPFDLMFWQVTASAIDVMIILPGTTIFKKASPGSMDHVKTGAKTEGEGVTSKKRSASSMSRRWSLSGLASLKKEDGKDD